MNAYIIVMDAVAAVILFRHYWHRLGRAHTMVEVLTDRLPPNAHAKQARLTAREQEVLELIRRGVITDGEIGEALHIASATAATHVQRILRKTGLHNRHDLMLLPPPNARSSFLQATRQNMAAGQASDRTS